MLPYVHTLSAGLELLEQQSRQEDVSCLPSLKVSDIASEIEKVQLTSSMEGKEECMLFRVESKLVNMQPCTVDCINTVISM